MNLFKTSVKDFKTKQTLASYVSERLNFLFFLIGTNRTGKTALAKQIAKDWKLDNHEGIVAIHDPQNKFGPVGELKDINITYTSTFEDELLELRNALIIFDDYRILFQKSIVSYGLANLIYQRANYNIDIVFICHNPSLILNFLTTFVTHYFIFYTQSKQGNFEKKIPNYDLCYGASVYVNKYVRTYGRGEYNVEKDEPEFPHIIIDNEKGELFAINMDKAL